MDVFLSHSLDTRTAFLNNTALFHPSTLWKILQHIFSASIEKSGLFLPVLLLLHSPLSAHTPLSSQIHTGPPSIPLPRPTFVSLPLLSLPPHLCFPSHSYFWIKSLKINLSRSYRPYKKLLLLFNTVLWPLGCSIALVSFKKPTYLSQENTALGALKLSPPVHTHRHTPGTQNSTSSSESCTNEMEEGHARISVFSYRYNSVI